MKPKVHINDKQNLINYLIPVNGIQTGQLITYREDVYYKGRLITKLIENKRRIKNSNLDISNYIPFYFDNSKIAIVRTDYNEPKIQEIEPGVYVVSGNITTGEILNPTMIYWVTCQKI